MENRFLSLLLLTLCAINTNMARVTFPLVEEQFEIEESPIQQLAEFAADQDFKEQHPIQYRKIAALIQVLFDEYAETAEGEAELE